MKECNGEGNGIKKGMIHFIPTEMSQIKFTNLIWMKMSQNNSNRTIKYNFFL